MSSCVGLNYQPELKYDRPHKVRPLVNFATLKLDHGIMELVKSEKSFKIIKCNRQS